MRWLSRRPPPLPRIPGQSRTSARRGLPERPHQEESPKFSYFANTNDTNQDDTGIVLPEAVPSQHDAPPRWPDHTTLGDATSADPADLLQAIYEEEKLGWRSSVTAQPTVSQSQHLKKIEILNTDVSISSVLTDDESKTMVAIQKQTTPTPQQQAVSWHSDTEDVATPTTTYVDTSNLPHSSAVHSKRDSRSIVSAGPRLAALADGSSSAIQSISPSLEVPEKKQRQFPLAIPKPSFKFLPMQPRDPSKQLDRSKSMPSKQQKHSLRGKAKPNELQPAVKKLRFSTDIYNRKPSPKKKRPSKHKNVENIIRSSFARSRSTEVSPRSSSYPLGSINITPIAEPTDQPAEPISSPAKTPKAKTFKPSKPFSKPRKRVTLAPLPPTAIPDTPSVPGQPYEHIRLPEDTNPLKKLRLSRLAKPKANIQHAIRRTRKIALRKGILQFMLGRQLAGPVAANLSVLAGRKSEMEGGPGPGLWGLAEGVLRERSLMDR